MQLSRGGPPMAQRIIVPTPPLPELEAGSARPSPFQGPALWREASALDRKFLWQLKMPHRTRFCLTVTSRGWRHQQDTGSGSQGESQQSQSRRPTGRTIIGEAC
ncbi:hypothetical protein VTN96DRAFT_767 [Rasamsonia emersonii]